MPGERRGIVTVLFDRYGRTFADEAGITLTDRPSPLYQLLVLSTLLSARITASLALAAARELFTAGYRTPETMLKAGWQDRVDALGRGHYRRYDERTATMLGDGARLCQQRWHGDLRRMRDAAHGDLGQLQRLLTEFPGIGPTGAAIFLREVQAVWTGLAPFVDAKVSAGARALGLPPSGHDLATLVAAPDFPRLASALVRVSLAGEAAEEIRQAARERHRAPGR